MRYSIHFQASNLYKSPFLGSMNFSAMFDILKPTFSVKSIFRNTTLLQHLQLFVFARFYDAWNLIYVLKYLEIFGFFNSFYCFLFLDIKRKNQIRHKWNFFLRFFDLPWLIWHGTPTPSYLRHRDVYIVRCLLIWCTSIFSKHYFLSINNFFERELRST